VAARVEMPTAFSQQKRRTRRHAGRTISAEGGGGRATELYGAAGEAREEMRGSV